jgi:hypothetical protein
MGAGMPGKGGGQNRLEFVLGDCSEGKQEGAEEFMSSIGRKKVRTDKQYQARG